jgi:methylenetetrahydrofolate dehydrogenase (NADP+) / methenyltetrahydrofolate cyclohydrolase
MIVDGRKIAAEIYSEVAAKVAVFEHIPKLGIITCAPNVETRQYLELKKRKADDVGIELLIKELLENTKTEEVIKSIKEMCESVDGVVVQLPLPPHIDRELVLASIPTDKDPDGFSYPKEGSVLPPVVGAVEEIGKIHDMIWENKKVVIFGMGRLVGQPCAAYAKGKGAEVFCITKESTNTEELLETADIIIAGAGSPRAILPEMVKEGVAIFDAGASEDGGTVVGDVSSEVAKKAAIFTPVPGGIGPVTVALLLRNLIDLTQ